MPKLSSSFTKLPSLGTIKPLKPAFVQMPKLSSSFTKLPSLQAIKPLKPAFVQLPKLNSGLNLFKPMKPVFVKLEPYKNLQPIFSKNTFKFTALPALKTQEFKPYSFNVHKIEPLKTYRLEVVKPSYKLISSLPQVEPAKAFTSAQLIAQTELAKSLNRQPILQPDTIKVRTLALLSKDIPAVAVMEKAPAQEVSNLETLKGYITSTTAITEVQNIASRAVKLNPEGISLKVTSRYANPLEGLVSGRVPLER
jgi:hypothetical protein